MPDIINVICPVCHHAQAIPSGGELTSQVKKYNAGLNPETEILIQVRESIGGGGRGVKTKGTGFITKQALTFSQALRDTRYSRIARRIADKLGRVYDYVDREIT